MSLPTSHPVRQGCCWIQISVFRRCVNQASWRRPVGCWWPPSHPIAGTTTENRALIASKNRTAAGFSIKAVMR